MAISRAVRELGKQAGLELTPFDDGILMVRSPAADELEAKVWLPRTFGKLTVPVQLVYDGPRNAIDGIARAADRTAASLRGQRLRELVLGTAPIDFIGDAANENGAWPAMTEHERCERLGTALIEAGEKLMRRAEVTR